MMTKKNVQAKRCPECGGHGPFGAVSGLCYPCSDRATDLRDYYGIIYPDPEDRLTTRVKKEPRYILTDGVNYYVGGLAIFVKDRAMAVEMPKKRAAALLKVWRVSMGTSLKMKAVR